MASSKPSVDWERVEADYCAGIKSLREIAAEHGTKEGTIRSRAKAQDWVRDISAKVAAKAQQISRKEDSRSISRSEKAATEREIIEASAQAIVNVKLSHRKSISRQRDLVERLLQELEAQTGDTELFDQLGELMHAPDDKGVDKLNDIYKKVIATPQRIDSLKKLAETLKHLIYLEREAFDITPAPTPQDNALQAIAKAIQGNTLPIVHEDAGADDDAEG
ncbi:MAG TPA: hypothetical protein PK782_12440 [Nitrospira sp.]|nr:hypothetical protein [Nitrospira sp.]